MYTEDEARTKQCWKKLGHDSSYGNQEFHCHASDCMAWTWVDQIKDTKGAWNVRPQSDRGFSSLEPIGYCGLARRGERP